MFADRTSAGQALAHALQDLAGQEVVILALPRGGVPVAFEIARALKAPLDLVLVQKLGTPFQEELALGALASYTGEVVCFLNEALIAELGLDEKALAALRERGEKGLAAKEKGYGGARLRPSLRGRSVILVDDGVATGATMQAALHAVKQAGAGQTILAVPIAPPATVRKLARVADRVVALIKTDDLPGVSLAYGDFHQVSDDEVVALLEESRAFLSRTSRPETGLKG